MDLLIRRLGYAPVLISEGKDALEHVWNDPPSRILLDILMILWMEGIFGKLRSRPACTKIPVIIFSRINGSQ